MRRTLLACLVPFALVFASVVRDAHAQPKPRHQGLNISIAVGQGQLHTVCAGCSWSSAVPDAAAYFRSHPGSQLPSNFIYPPPPERERGNLLSLRAGWTVRDWVILGAEGTFLRRVVATADVTEPIRTSLDV